ncbi:MAG: UDP-3-O-acyl-N-acetylglucosamine deacetylase [Pseudolabrys sp.]|nr:UDP-3-O-acyl-N-acetylglucosamine deacetylase [Pseudolabrys sp.]
MKGAKQTTLREQVTVSGTGVHSGLPVTLTMHPADDDTGIVFQRVNPDGTVGREIRADVRAVTATEFATVLGDAQGPLCSTAEHLLAALRGLGVDNVVIEIDGPEVPIMDGSAGPFVAALDQAGLTSRAQPRRYIEVVKPVRVTKGDAIGELRPYAHGFRIEAEIAFDHPLIGRQALMLDVTPDVFRREIARARTFGFMKDVARLWSAGYALGANLDNTLVVTEDRILNPDGLRFSDEFVRHKVLDAIGDLALAGLPLIACYSTLRGGHRLNYAVLSALLADRTAWRVVEGSTEPARRMRGQGRAGLVAPAFGPERS